MENRREFIKTISAAGVVTVCGGLSVVFSGCSTVPRITPEKRENELILSQDAFIESNMIVVDQGLLKPPIFVHKTDAGDYSALLLSCTHKGCRPRVYQYSLDCPCHGSQFDFRGNVLEGPAERNLKSYPVSQDGSGNLLIRL